MSRNMLVLVLLFYVGLFCYVNLDENGKNYTCVDFLMIHQNLLLTETILFFYCPWFLSRPQRNTSATIISMPWFQSEVGSLLYRLEQTVRHRLITQSYDLNTLPAKQLYLWIKLGQYIYTSIFIYWNILKIEHIKQYHDVNNKSWWSLHRIK